MRKPPGRLSRESWSSRSWMPPSEGLICPEHFPSLAFRTRKDNLLLLVLTGQWKRTRRKERSFEEQRTTESSFPCSSPPPKFPTHTDAQTHLQHSCYVLHAPCTCWHISLQDFTLSFGSFFPTAKCMFMWNSVFLYLLTKTRGQSLSELQSGMSIWTGPCTCSLVHECFHDHIGQQLDGTCLMVLICCFQTVIRLHVHNVCVCVRV